MNGAEAQELSDDAIRESILNPIGAPRLSDLAKGKEKVVIAIDDMTRTTQISRIFPYVLEELTKANIHKEQIKIIAAVGAHRPMNREDFLLKLGESIVNTIEIENHHP